MTKQEQRKGLIRLGLMCAAALALAGYGLTLASHGSGPETTTSPEGVEVPVDPWQIPGYKRGMVARIWVDPETKCHYLVVGGSYGWGLVPRYDADGSSLICNQPVPKEAQ